MALCDMCGKDAPLFGTEIEGVILNVCQNCSKHGKVLKKIKEPIREKKKAGKKEKIEPQEFPETEEHTVDNCGEIIRKIREKLGKTQKDFSQMLNEKESIIQKIETDNFTPSLPAARRYEKILKIKLVERIELIKEPKKTKTTEGLTIGDILTVKK